MGVHTYCVYMYITMQIVSTFIECQRLGVMASLVTDSENETKEFLSQMLHTEQRFIQRVGCSGILHLLLSISASSFAESAVYTHAMYLVKAYHFPRTLHSFFTLTFNYQQIDMHESNNYVHSICV